MLSVKDKDQTLWNSIQGRVLVTWSLPPSPTLLLTTYPFYFTPKYTHALFVSCPILSVIPRRVCSFYSCAALNWGSLLGFLPIDTFWFFLGLFNSDFLRVGRWRVSLIFLSKDSPSLLPLGYCPMGGRFLIWPIRESTLKFRAMSWIWRYTQCLIHFTCWENKCVCINQRIWLFSVLIV